MNTYEQVYKCMKCPWMKKVSESNYFEESAVQDFRNLVGIGLMSDFSKCPECGGNVKKSTRKAA